jgi:Ca2+/H+ antiporter, TMEM165/GDT1 family
MQAFWATFATAFLAVFVAELGDKTQLAALGLAASTERPWAVLAGSTLALVLAATLAVLAGRALHKVLEPRWLHYGGAALFVAIGVVMLVRGPR